MRLDKYLKVSRLIKRRTVANDACDGQRITVNGRTAKASYDVKIGDVIEIAIGQRTVKVEVLAVTENAKKDDAPKVLTHVPREEFPAQTLTIELYLEAGIRGCEIGYILADRDPVTHENRFNGLDLLRLAIPRRVYTDNHMNVIAAALKNVYERRESITHGVRIAWEAPLMRHFTVQLERL